MDQRITVLVSRRAKTFNFDGVGAFAEAMRARGFTNHELDLMFKENPARLLALSGQ